MGKNDLNKSYKELVNILDKKLENKNVGKNYECIIKNKKILGNLLFDRIRSIYTKYYSKYDRFKTKYNTYRSREEAHDAAIKFYSHYKALKVIGDVCKDIIKEIEKIEETNDGKKVLSDEETREFMGALDVAKLAKEQKKFELRADNNKFGNEKGEVRIAEILNAHKKMRMSMKTKKQTFIAPTPFGEINICCEQNPDGSETRIIKSINDQTKESYTVIATNLDNVLKKLNEQGKQNLITCIKSYVNQKIRPYDMSILNTDDENAEEILTQIKSIGFVNSNVMTIEEKKSAAILCGCLLFAESSQVRNPTRGKLEKKAIKKVEKFIKQNCTNPFGVVFAGQSVNNPSVIDDKNKLYTPAKSVGGQKDKPWEVGGQYQTEWLITGKADIVHNLLKKKQGQLYVKLRKGLKTISDPSLLTSLRETVENWEDVSKQPNYSKEIKAMFDDAGLSSPASYDVKLIRLYFASDKSRKKIKIKNIPDDFIDARNHMLESIKENRKNLHELNKK